LEHTVGADDRKRFTDAVAKANSTGVLHTLFVDDTSDWVEALYALNRLAMFDMLPALEAIGFFDRNRLETTEGLKHVIGDGGIKRIQCARHIVELREIQDDGLPPEQINDGREYLGCTRLDDDGVQKIIDEALSKARTAVAAGAEPLEPCCGVYRHAWAGRLPNHATGYDPACLVAKRRAYANASLNSNMAAAAHYLLARYHVCAAKATPSQMNTVIEGYDAQKRQAIAHGDRDLKTIALTPNNRPFPPDFVIRNWAKKGSADGDVDRLQCNASASQPILLPDVNGQEL
jgi:hypothetical protein